MFSWRSYKRSRRKVQICFVNDKQIVRYFTCFIPLFCAAKILQPVSTSPCWQTEAVLAVFMMLYVGKRAKRTVIWRRLVVAGCVLIVFLSMKVFCPFPAAFYRSCQFKFPSLFDWCLWNFHGHTLCFAPAVSLFAAAKPLFAPTKPSFAAGKPSFAPTKRKKALLGVRQLFVFWHKTSDMRHTISLSRRPRFLCSLPLIRPRGPRKRRGGAKGLHLLPHWQADYNNE